jgi:magnesium-transporting ATPase (P-type)
MDYNGILSDITNVSLVILGICITIFTVVYSFVINKKDEVTEILNKSKIGTVSLDEKQKYIFAKRIIDRYKKLNTNLIYLCIFSSASFLSSIFLNRILFNECSQTTLSFFWSVLFLIIITILYFAVIFTKVITSYFKDIKM